MVTLELIVVCPLFYHRTAWFSLQGCELEKGRKNDLASLKSWIVQDGGAA
ncbi:MAG: hypothetical protein JKY62_15115 [Desulfocapsa sp.]|uniref:Transposase n=1 Tax=Desulfotalea psychrophila TaxID=84980 RepID=A0ABS3AV22_9BACT|nr:hypothetical protein [Desulfocapsa sp.]MBN4068599.1 hypothetical protein [Desulfotalea psychrophila]